MRKIKRCKFDEWTLTISKTIPVHGEDRNMRIMIKKKITKVDKNKINLDKYVFYCL